MLLEVEGGLDRPLPRPRAVHEVRERPVAVRPDDEAHVPRLLQELRAESLRHASRHPDDRLRLHVALELTEAPDHPLLGVVADGAGVQQDDVGALGPLHRVVAGCGELSEHQLGIAHVHLAAVRFDVDGRSGHGIAHCSVLLRVKRPI